MQYIPIDGKPMADILTKDLTEVKFVRFRELLNIV